MNFSYPTPPGARPQQHFVFIIDKFVSSHSRCCAMKTYMASRKVLLVGWDAADWKVIHPLMDAGKMPNVQRLVKNGAIGTDRHAASAAFADAVDFHRHRKAAVQAWHPRLLRAHSGRPRRAAGHQPFAKIESAVEHSQSERSAQRRDRLVAQPSRRTDQRRDGFRPLPSRQRAARSRAGRCWRMRFIRRNWPKRWPVCACIPTC